MSLFIIIVAAILTAAWLFRNPGFLRNFAIGFFGVIAFLFILGLVMMGTN